MCLGIVEWVALLAAWKTGRTPEKKRIKKSREQEGLPTAFKSVENWYNPEICQLFLDTLIPWLMRLQDLEV